ncbi:4-(cytidine 5'-diphospho)-2-C-methyl-D-erythritol kinase [Calycomorphotria hydatis]|uniref:4-diphosphocytidyl-2-C-methyl-D-erythritol kinase n=1 Tax=Calycomorphotria hydatis TaxID=2528027 RepID=A0A517T9H9_9PLAN|nr:4-(cytidine 5'-diphospho)-2-C-methyl-D-erythritol kinase [Calycomorphotria hydatis]QDT65034.1 4-diphosphocytidyl-2-C-methyl-D-erythritol kinase [Calycomorphotria hydatis]
MHLCSSGARVQIRTPAKVNFSLDVLRRRSDGYHEVATLLAKVSVYDTLSFTRRTDDQISLCIHSLTNVATEPLPTDGRNIIVKAAELLRPHAPHATGVDITLWKRIPIAAGMGGGSSDAAATLLALNEFWKANLPQPELLSLAAELGSDVPFFVLNENWAVGRGRGEDLQPLPVTAPLPLIVVKPPSGLSAGEVYKNCQPDERDRTSALVQLLQGGRYEQLPGQMSNGLQQSAYELNAEVRKTLDALSQELPGRVMLSGSGTACFGVCRNMREALARSARLRGLQLGHVMAMTTRC